MATLLDPAILFFVLGIVAGAARPNLEIPQQVAGFLSLYLLMALGLKGGFALAQSGLTAQVATGLGLAIVKHVAQRHGAVLRIDSRLGVGSRFSITFPANRLRVPAGAMAVGMAATLPVKPVAAAQPAAVSA